MPLRTDSFDLGRLGLTSGEGRRLDLHVGLDAFDFGGQRYEVKPAWGPASGDRSATASPSAITSGTPPPEIPVKLDVSRTTGNGWALRLRFAAELAGPCMRCLEPAGPRLEVDAREVQQPGGGEELQSPYVNESDELDLGAWARDALALALPSQITCREECRGLCPQCGANLNDEPDHAHEREPDPRWAKLSEIRFE